MAILKCKMCGGTLQIVPGKTVVECEYCGSTQTVPSLDNEKKATLFERANRLRAVCEFDKAASVYEAIVADFNQEAEAYWGLVLCKYGIEYVDDPATGKKIPTCHRSSFDSIFDDANFDMVMENTDEDALEVYRREAKQIEEIRKGIIEVSSKEKPYDVFICYKETDNDGNRTLDSVLAQDIYTELTDKGYKVFFSRITLEDKLGQEYEPYIFAALNSAKVMLVVGTSYVNYNAVWVKNEWSRFLKLISAGQKKTLIPCYKNIDAYDMPKEFAKLQAQDMGKVGAMQDLLRGIDKIFGKEKQSKETILIKNDFANAEGLLKRGFLALENREWDNAETFFDQALNAEPENGQGYLGKLLAEQKSSDIAGLADGMVDLETLPSYRNAVRFADESTKRLLDEAAEKVQENIKEEKYQTALKLLESTSKQDVEQAEKAFTELASWSDAENQLALCQEKLEQFRTAEKKKQAQKKRGILVGVVTAVFIVLVIVGITFNKKVLVPRKSYNEAVALMNSGQYQEAFDAFIQIRDYADAGEQAYNAALNIKAITDRCNALAMLWDYDKAKIELKNEIEYLLSMPSAYKTVYQIIVKIPDSDFKNEIEDNCISKWIAYVKISANEINNFKECVNLKERHYETLYESIISGSYSRSISLLRILPPDYKESSIILAAYDDIEKCMSDYDNWVDDVGNKSIDRHFDELANKNSIVEAWNIDVIRNWIIDDYNISEFMRGTWRTADGQYYINFYAAEHGSTSSEYNLPQIEKPSGTKHYGIKDQTYIWEDDNNNELAKVFKFDFTSPNQMNVYCYKDNRTYTMYR